MKYVATACVIGASILTIATSLHAATPDADAARQTPDLSDEVVVTGSRGSGQRLDNSPIPIDKLSGDSLLASGHVDLKDALIQAAPSITTNVYSANAAAFKDVLTLHGLNPNHVLVLVNSKRRHSTSNITLAGGPQQGATGVDIDFIPAGAVDHVEILRDGDSAQYGSDAIAGVVNIILKSDDQGGALTSSAGLYYPGDGFSRQVTANAGFKLGDDGFINLGAEYSGHDHTKRRFLDQRSGLYSNLDPNLLSTNRESVSLNAGYRLQGGAQIYVLGTYGHRTGSEYENPRLPSVLPAIYPNGFTPQQTIDEDDYSATAGIKDGSHPWAWDLSTTYGRDRNSVGIFNSGNTDLFADTGSTPTRFKVYSVASSDWTSNLDIRRSLGLPLLSAPLDVAFGGEGQREIYAIGAGDAASSYRSGAQSLPGLTTHSAGSYSRWVESAYVDVGTDLAPRWRVDLSGRYSHYSDTGNTVNGKLATRYAITNAWSIRGSVGTGFDAPSLAQKHFTNLSVSPTTSNGLLAADSDAARQIGASPLKPEKSRNYSVGTVYSPAANFSLTVDAYQVDIRDRIVNGGTISGQAALDAIKAAGFTVYSGIPLSAVHTSFFTNGANTRTRGIDIAARLTTDLQDAGIIRWSAAANINHTSLTHVRPGADGLPILNAQQRAWLTSSTPRYKILLSGDWKKGKWGLTARENIFGPTSGEETYSTGPNANSTTIFNLFRQNMKYTTDLAVHFQLNRKTSLSIGANNVFDVYPKELPLENRFLGYKYDGSSSQLSALGGYYYMNIGYTF